MAAVFYIDPAPDIYSPSPNTAVENPNETDFIFPPSPSPAAADSGRTGDDSSPTTAVNPQAGFKGDGRLESPIEHSGRNLRLLDSAVKAELIGAVQQRHNRSVSSTSAQSNRSTSSNSSSVFNQRPIKARRFSTGLVYYELLSNIGGVEDVSFLFYARHIPTGDDVTLKYTDLGISSDFKLIEKLVASIKNSAFCHHEYILPYHCSYVEDGCLWTVTPPVRAGSCKALLEEHFPTGFGDVAVATILRKVLLALIYMHENRMIHNDIRATNILMDTTGEIRVTGLHSVAHLLEGGELRTSVFTPIGSNFEWAAPEIIGQAEVHDEKADIYSIGITALELAFNQTPFDDWPPLKILLSKLKYPYPRITPPKGKEMGDEFSDFVDQCLQRDPAKRPSAKQLINHSFLRNAKGKSHLEKHIIRPTGIREKHEKALRQHKELKSPVSET